MKEEGEGIEISNKRYREDENRLLIENRAAIYTSTNAPPGTSEWSLSGLHPLPSILIKPTYVAESAFSVECKLVSKQEIRSPVTGERTAVLCIVEAVQFQ